MHPPEQPRLTLAEPNPIAGRSRSSPVGFTLVELLVTIAVIALLVALLFPVGKRAIQAARDSQCKSNLKLLYSAYRSYSLDNNGDTLVDGTFPNEWTRLVQPYIGHPYFTTKLPKRLFCPVAKSIPNASFYQPDYAANVHGGVFDSTFQTTAARKLAGQERPSQVIVFLDWIPGWRFARIFEVGQVNDPAQSKDRVFRHNGKLNAVFGDGHVESLSHPLPTDYKSPPWR